MKKLILLGVVAILACSCAKNYYQIVDVKSQNLQTESDNYVYADANVKVVYNFWSDGGNPGFAITNKTDKTIYVDLTNSFFVKNGIAYDYFLNRTFGKGTSTSVSKGLSASAGVSKALGLAGTVLGKWNIWGSYAPGSLTASASIGASLAATASTQTASGVSSNVSYGEKPIVAIPPHSMKCISEYNILNDVIQECDIKLFAKKGKPEVKHYSEAESPLKFENYITYYVGDKSEPISIENNFYVSGYTNYAYKDIHKKGKTGCKEQIRCTYITKSSGTAFYNTYAKNHSNNYSADAPKAAN